MLCTPLTRSNRFCRVLTGERYSFKIKYRFQVFVPKRQILPCAVMRIIRSALTCLSVPFTTFPHTHLSGQKLDKSRDFSYLQHSRQANMCQYGNAIETFLFLMPATMCWWRILATRTKGGLSEFTTDGGPASFP